MLPQPLFAVFGIDVDMYGICVATGIVVCFLFLIFTAKIRNFNTDVIGTMSAIGLIAVAIGVLFAMLFQSLYDFIANPSAGFVMQGKTTFLGGLLGGVGSFLLLYYLYFFVVNPRTKRKWLKTNVNAGLTDALPFIPIGITLAHGFGRIGCFFAGCCYGIQTDAWFGIVFLAADDPPYPVIPTQLFEAIFLFLLSAVMIVLFFRFRFQCNFALYAISYGIWRFLIEFIRGDDIERGKFIGALTPSQFWCILMVLLGVAYIFLYKYVLSEKMKHPELQSSEKREKGKS